MTNHGQIVSRGESQTNRFFEAVTGQDRAHIEIVSHDETAETQFFAQQLSDNPARQTGGRFFGFEARIPTVANHHAVDDSTLQVGAIDLNRPRPVR